ncbi:type II toxin-antitoxin system prevent-host-death family antitoxin [soil metagenome]
MKTQVNIHEAKTHLSRLVERAANGEEIVIARAGRPIARLAPLVQEGQPRRGGIWKGKGFIHDNFDDPLDEEFEAAFRGESP